ncbi:acetylserotonin O-methyltransferase [Suncus etruscus]|uniref:acetylserotonin O-methyltransferase n=1 Tax=Suncus etruscus TaxID=109475 RepID=UPI00210FEEF3|nr:acetylserotonin O-methyltransferase [Suncus etruscus]
MSSSDPDADFGVLSELAHGFMASQVLFAACDLGVFDLLEEASQPLDAATVATRLGTSTRGTRPLLDTCVTLNLLRVQTLSDTALYSNSELASTYLARASPRCQCHMFLYLAGTTYPCWAHLAEAVREGRNQYQRAFGVGSDPLFAAIYRSEGELLRFMKGLQEGWTLDGPALLTAFDLAPFAHICDLGGGSGALARLCASLYPACHVTVFDIPEVVQMAGTHFPLQEEEKDRVTFQAGDFFLDPLPEADLFILARVLHDWSDQKCSKLLARVFQACRAGGAVLVVESVLDPDGRGPLTTQLYSLNMLIQSEGLERTAPQYRALLRGAGFDTVSLRHPTGTYQAILGSK